MVQVILYYNYVHIEDVSRFRADHYKLCSSLKLSGRIYIAEEGINGTLAGADKNIQKYKEHLLSLEGFEQTAFKVDTCEENPFRKLIVRIRPEIAALKATVKVNPGEAKAKHLSPEEWKKAIESDEDFIMIDVRNDYEYAIGHFTGAIMMTVNNFFQSEEWLDHCHIPKDKKILMYCTGGIRCEKFSLLMQAKGYTDVSQLDGGIIHYAHSIGDDHFQGKCFVFDDRLAVEIEKNQKKPLAECVITGKPCDDYINCANPDCNKLFICSAEGARKMQGCCSNECLEADRKRPFDPDNIYAPSKKWYQYFDSKSR